MSEKLESGQADQTSATAASSTPICGIVRPIASMDEVYTESHWTDVHNAVAAAVKAAGYDLRLVSEGGTGIIVADIIDHLYSDPLVIIDVSARNPNVMFELGMRVTFEKPIIIIKDDATPFSFDITPIKHLVYRRDLRMPSMIKFQAELTEAVISTMNAADTDQYRHYLQKFGPIDATTLSDRTVDATTFLEGLSELRRAVANLDAKFEMLGNVGGGLPKSPASRRNLTSERERLFVDFNVNVDAARAQDISRTLPILLGADSDVLDTVGGRTNLRVRFIPDRSHSISWYLDQLHNALGHLDPTATVSI